MFLTNIRLKKMCNRATLENGRTLESVPNQYKTQQMWNKAVNNYAHALKPVPDWYKTQEMCIKAVDNNPSTVKYVLDQFKTPEMCIRLIFAVNLDSRNSQEKTQTDWSDTSKMIQKLFTALYADENILYFDEGFGNVVCNCNEMGVLNIDLNNINLDNNFDEDDPDTIIHVRLLAWRIKFEKCKALKKIIKWRTNACGLTSQYMVGLVRVRREKRNRSNVNWRVTKCASVVYKWGVLKHLASWVLEHCKFKFIKVLNHNLMKNWFKYFEQKIKQYLSKNVSIPSGQNKSQWVKFSISPFCILLS